MLSCQEGTRKSAPAGQKSKVPEKIPLAKQVRPSYL